MVQKQNVEFAAEDNVNLRGWLFVPDGPGHHPAITMAHGFAGVKEHGLERFAQVFAAAQFIGVVIAASLVLGEPISPARWFGVACISFGIVLVGLTAQA